MITIYTQLFNAEKMRFKWREAIRNWFEFLDGIGEICIAINTSEDNTPELVRAWCEQLSSETPHSQTKFKVIDIQIPYTDPAFDGLGKAAALSHATQPFAILLDIDEFVIPSQRKLWMKLAGELQKRRDFDSFLIPVVDLIQDEQHFKSIGSKFYLHRTSPNITRGVFKGGYREDGSININSSDSTELIYADTQELVRAQFLIMPQMPDFIKIGTLESGETPYVLHYGWIDAEQRVRQSDFWRPVWENRDQKPGSQPKTTLADLEKIKRFRHNLPDWRVA